jgi:coproporphyrinogen III oxidase
MESGLIKQDGPANRMVKESSSQLYSPFDLVPVYANHSDLVKFHSAMDQAYQTVVQKIEECIGE